MAAEIRRIDIPINERHFWEMYVTTVQYEAGESLGVEANPQALQAAQASERIHTGCRPSLTKWHADQVENAFPWACMIGQAISVVGSFLAFHTYGVYDRQERTVEITRAMSERVGGWHRPEDGPVRRAIRDFARDQLAIDELNTSRVQKYAISALVFVAGSACTLAGALIDGAWLITVGKVVMVTAVIGAIVTYLWHRNDTARYSRMIVISYHEDGRGPGIADKILQNLYRLHQANMEFQAEEVNVHYDALYPEHYVEWQRDLPARVR